MPRRGSAPNTQISGSDLVLVIGTSGIVYPAAVPEQRALAAGTPVIEFNIDESALSRMSPGPFRTSAAVGLPALLDALGEWSPRSPASNTETRREPTGMSAHASFLFGRRCVRLCRCPSPVTFDSAR